MKKVHRKITIILSHVTFIYSDFLCNESGSIHLLTLILEVISERKNVKVYNLGPFREFFFAYLYTHESLWNLLSPFMILERGAVSVGAKMGPFILSTLCRCKVIATDPQLPTLTSHRGITDGLGCNSEYLLLLLVAPKIRTKNLFLKRNNFSEVAYI